MLQGSPSMLGVALFEMGPGGNQGVLSANIGLKLAIRVRKRT